MKKMCRFNPPKLKRIMFPPNTTFRETTSHHPGQTGMRITRYATPKRKTPTHMRSIIIQFHRAQIPISIPALQSINPRCDQAHPLTEVY